MEREQKPAQPVRQDRIEWFTVRYRSLMIGAAVLAIVAALAAWAFFGKRAPEPPPPPVRVETGARFLSIEGSVHVKRAGTLEWVEATTAAVLRSNDLVRTSTGSTAEIRFADDTRFSVRPDSLITIEESSQNPVSHQQRVALSIHSGEANFQTAARTIPGETTISTPTVRTTADRETAGNIQVDESGDTGIRIFQGSGRAETTAGQQIQLDANEGIQVAADGSAGEKTTLPGVPELVAPPDATEVAYPDPTRAITLLSWNGVDGAESYRVTVDYSRSFARPLVDRQGYDGTQMQLSGLDLLLEGGGDQRGRRGGKLLRPRALLAAEGRPERGLTPTARRGRARAQGKHPPRAGKDCSRCDADDERRAYRGSVRRIVQRIRHVRGRRRRVRGAARDRGDRSRRRSATADRGDGLRPS
jgi:hypothetical protein